MFAAGLFAKGVHEFRELFDLDGAWYSTPVWEITGGPLATGTTYDFLREGCSGGAATRNESGSRRTWCTSFHVRGVYFRWRLLTAGVRHATGRAVGGTG